MDVDGVLTGGELVYTEDGEGLKLFNVYDGLGIKILQKAGIKTGVISGRESKALESRLKELGIDEIFMGRREKDKVLAEISKRLSIGYEEIGFVGDDLVDIPAMKRVGFPIAVRNAPKEVKKVAVYETMNEGGSGAVREVCELILKLRNFPFMEKYSG